MGNKLHTVYRSVFISDLHLGTHTCHAMEIYDFLRNHRCEYLYLVGDIVDGWRLRRSSKGWSQKHTDVIQKILKRTRQNTKVIYIIGNHDEFLMNFNDLDIGNILFTDKIIHVTQKNKKMLVVHGHQYDLVTMHFKLLAIAAEIGYQPILKLNKLYNYIRRITGRQYWSFSQYIKLKIKAAVDFLSNHEKAAILACQNEKTDGIICGHTHNPCIKTINDYVYVNCGDWVENLSAIVENVDGELELISWNHTKTNH